MLDLVRPAVAMPPIAGVCKSFEMAPEHDDRDEIVELMSRYANMADTKDWDELPASVFCDEFTCDFSSLGTPVMRVSRDAW